jgi:phosphate transport system protein
MSEHGHIVSAFSHEIETLKSRIMQMGGLAEQILADAVAALDGHDLELAQRTVQADQRIDAIEDEIREQSILMLARRQPLAGDLREVMAAIRIGAELERIGDLAKNIAKRVTAVGIERRPARVTRGVDHMTDLALSQLKDVLNAYAARDAAKAVQVRDRDEEIDALYNSLFRELLTYMMEDPRSISMSAHLLFCAKNIERVGDHATNIAETVYYVATGDRLHEERRKDDSHAYAAVSPPTGQQDGR